MLSLRMKPAARNFPSNAIEHLRLPLRWVGVMVLFAAEIVWGIDVFTVPDFSQQTGVLAHVLAGSETALKIGFAFAATFVICLSRRFAEVAAEFKAVPPSYRWWPWVVCHVLALGVFVHIASPVFGAHPSAAAASARWLASWLVAGVLALLFLLLVLAPSAQWARLLMREWKGLLVSALAGGLAWLSGVLAQTVWRPLAEMTLWLVHHLLLMIYSDVYHDPQGLVGTPNFVAGIAPVCSGYEGIGLIAVFVAIYLWFFRAQLKFPHALLLFPLGIVAIWLANVVRITLLIVIGSSISPEIAVEGFHSQAGWIAFCLIALGLIALSHRLHLSCLPEGGAAAQAQGHSRHAAALLAPLLSLLAASMLIAALSSGFNALYPLGVVTTAAVLWRYRRDYRPYLRVPHWGAIAIGIVVFSLWMLLVPRDEARGGPLPQHLHAWPLGLAAAWIAFRIVGSVLTVPIAEELAFRGYLIRKLVASDFESVSPESFTWLSFLLSSVLFGVLHGDWIAGVTAGAGFAIALYLRGQLIDAVVAHMTANALIVVAVLGFGQWHLWV